MIRILTQPRDSRRHRAASASAAHPFLSRAGYVAASELLASMLHSLSATDSLQGEAQRGTLRISAFRAVAGLDRGKGGGGGVGGGRWEYSARRATFFFDFLSAAVQPLATCRALLSGSEAMLTLPVGVEKGRRSVADVVRAAGVPPSFERQLLAALKDDEEVIEQNGEEVGRHVSVDALLRRALSMYEQQRKASRLNLAHVFDEAAPLGSVSSYPEWERLLQKALDPAARDALSDEESREVFGAAQQASLALNPPDQIGKVSKAAFVHVAAEAGLTARGGGADLTSRSMRRAA